MNVADALLFPKLGADFKRIGTGDTELSETAKALLERLEQDAVLHTMDEVETLPGWMPEHTEPPEPSQADGLLELDSAALESLVDEEDEVFAMPADEETAEEPTGFVVMETPGLVDGDVQEQLLQLASQAGAPGVARRLAKANLAS